MKLPFEIISGIVAGLICKVYFRSVMKNKIKNYENDILENQERIRQLEDLNEKLEKRLKDFESQFLKHGFSMN
ncbi:hypothetical protein [Segetibacter koreensis]|uniref:hypothetical protein n=1 Tax=Segetibacter koreensis TaxID=398037 RepID=UPI000375F029|nr:hypothetical protein [Segetibacter koreensis]